ncbi:C40 family peptidase [Epibacterium ulvae]|uniref:NlpC/P60 family protein n=1 Tax=Epibacterium ulvae TaxID=1156985 RepID=UPI001BFC913D|nr:NlpC/P60 family protein [Epibacterium ulvae]MBT8152533.1 C40 family peptidase [Epibacterium ulvae]
MSGVRAAQEARRWLGTPYVHQSALRGAGCDCLGLIRGVYTALYGAAPEAPPAYSRDWSEPQGEERLWQAATRHLLDKPLGQAAPGDVILFRMRSGAVAKHLGLQTHCGAQARFIHAYQGHGVVESALSAPWQRRIVARFAFPEHKTEQE